MKRTVHLAASILAISMIATFFFSTLLVELLGSAAAIAAVKRLIVFPGLFILVPAIAATGASGFALARARRGALVDAKRRRMPFIALELAAGAANLTLMGLNLRDGLRLSGRLAGRTSAVQNVR